MATLVWSIFNCLVVMFYSSNLRANLTAVKYEPMVNSVEDILKQNRSAYFPERVPKFRREIFYTSNKCVLLNMKDFLFWQN